MADLYFGGWRLASTHRGDTLQRVAARELGSAELWPQIAWLNKLLPPYITDDPELASSGRVILSGASIRVPAPGERRPSVIPDEAYGSDVRLSAGRMDVDAAGGISLVSGVANASQALRHRLSAGRGELQFHPKYGNGAHRLLGSKASPDIAMLALIYSREAVRSDPRVIAVDRGVVAQRGDALVVSFTAELDGHRPLPLQVEI